MVNFVSFLRGGGGGLNWWQKCEIGWQVFMGCELICR